MGVKIKAQQWVFQHNPKKSLDQKLTLKNPMPNFRAVKFSRKDQMIYLQKKGISVMIKPVDKEDG